MPVTPGAILPRDMNDRQWLTYLSESGIQADRNVKTFTPTWTGFSVDPVGEISYMDFGAIVIMWSPAALQGISDSGSMEFSGVPEAIRPSELRVTAATALVDKSGVTQGFARVLTDGTVDFWINIVTDDGTGALYVTPSPGFFHNTSGKGLAAGWLIVYAK